MHPNTLHQLFDNLLYLNKYSREFLVIENNRLCEHYHTHAHHPGLERSVDRYKQLRFRPPMYATRVLLSVRFRKKGLAHKGKSMALLGSLKK
jgi:hypothetical protein